MSGESDEHSQNENSCTSSDQEQNHDESSKSQESNQLDYLYKQHVLAFYSDIKKFYAYYLRRYLRYIPSFSFMIILIVFLGVYGPILFEQPENITPEEETYSITLSVGEGGHEGDVYQIDESENTDSLREEFIAECTPEGDYLSTGGHFSCDYNVRSVYVNGSTELVEFDRNFLDRLVGEPLIIAKWERLSPEGETAYVTHYYVYSDDPTLSGIFAAYTPTEPGEYEFSLLINSYLNPIGPEHSEERVVLTSSSNVYVYSEEQASSFTISEATYRLEQVAIIGIAIGWIQLILSTYPDQRD